MTKLGQTFGYIFSVYFQGFKWYYLSTLQLLAVAACGMWRLHLEQDEACYKCEA